MLGNEQEVSPCYHSYKHSLTRLSFFLSVEVNTTKLVMFQRNLKALSAEEFPML